MAEDPKPKSGLFASLTLGRAAKTPRQPSETLTHPLLGASSSSLHLPSAPAETSTSEPTVATTQPSHSRQDSYTKAGGDIANLPYKPRQRHGAKDSASSMNSLFGAPNPTISTSLSPGLPPIASSSAPSTSPSTPTVAMTAPATTSTSTSATFTLPASASEAQVAVDSQHVIAGLSSSSATSRLQQQSLKAAAQRIGLGNGTMGMAMIDAVYDKCQLGKGKMAEGGEWAEVVKTLTAGKAVLLLPTTPASSLPVTPQILRDHILFVAPSNACLSKSQEDVPGASSAPTIAVSLSSMIGTIKNNAFVIESILPSDCSLMQAIRDPATRHAALSSLRSTALPLSASRPSFDLSSDTASLPFPPVNKAAAPSVTSEKADKEAREKDRMQSGKFGRINPFASFFGQAAPSASSASTPSSPSRAVLSGVTPDRAPSPAATDGAPLPTGAPGQLSPRPSLMSMEMSDAASLRSLDQSEGFSVTAHTISRPIRSSEVHKTLTKALRAAVREELGGLPEKVIDRTCKLVTSSLCAPSTPSEAIRSHHGPDSDASLVLDFADPLSAGDKLQAFIEAVYDDVTAHCRSEEGKTSALRRRASGSKHWQKAEGLADGKPTLTKEEVIEREASEAAEKAEGLVCSLLYNRLFSPIESDDARHDEVLASRIAALNMLDLSLDHLGLITQPEELDDDIKDKTSIQRGLRQIVHDIGLELEKLSQPSCLSPKDKGDVLIRAHKVVVDGLGRLPPIRLRPEGEPYKPAASEETVESALIATSGSPSPADTPLQEMQDLSSPDPDATPLSREPSRDPFDTPSVEQNERTPSAFEKRADAVIPALTITDPAQSPESSMIEEAMSDSVMTAQPETATSPSTPPQKPSTSGADLILPIIIFAVVKANPAQLASHLMYLRRYRSAICLTGEASYAIVNLTAVVEFLEHVEMAELGLGDDSGKVISVENLSPIGLTYLDKSNADAAGIVSASTRLRGRVFQVTEMVGSTADSANKALAGVVDSSWTALRGLMGTAAEQQLAVAQAAGDSSDPNVPRPNMRPRQASSFSLASVTASVASIAAAASTAAARSRSRATSRASETQQQWTGNQEMIEVSSRPESIHERLQEDESDGDDGTDTEADDKTDKQDVRSLSSVMSKDDSGNKAERASLSNRLASIGVLGRLSSPQSTTLAEDSLGSSPPDASPGRPGNGLLATLASGRARGSSLLGSAASIRSPSKTSIATPRDIAEPPIERFMTCEVGDIKLSEIGPLLRDYRRLAGLVESMKAGQS